MLKTFFINSTQADYGEEEMNYLQKFLLDQGVLHTQGANWNDFIDLAVSENDTPDMSIKVAIGNAVIETERNSVAFKVFVFNNAEVNLPISDNSSGDTRMDAIILKLSRTVEPNALMNNVATIEVVEGTSAVALTDNDIQTEIGADYDFLRLANVAVDDSETTILDADIGDTRTRVLTTDSIQYSPTVLKFKVVTADPSSPVEGEMWYNETDNKMRYYDGTAVINVEASSFTGGDGIDITSGEISVDLAIDSGLEFSGGKLKAVDVNYYGSGTDGDVVISIDTILTRDMNYNNLTINSGIKLSTNGFRVFVKGTLTNNGIIERNGNDGTNGGDGYTSTVEQYTTSNNTNVGLGGSAPSFGTIYGGVAGKNGGYGGGAGSGSTNPVAGENGTNGDSISSSLSDADGNDGANGGKGGSGEYRPPASGGTGGTGGTATAIKSNIYNIATALNLFETLVADAIVSLKSSAGGASGAGGGGGGTDANDGDKRSGNGGAGGGSGSSGGIVAIYAKSIINNGVIQANGGDGGDGGKGGDAYYTGSVTGGGGGGGGGAGGSGGVIILVYNTKTGSGTEEVNGGTGGTGGLGGEGTGGGDGTAGGNGENGNTGSVIELHII